jgi:hypothetical protein
MLPPQPVEGYETFRSPRLLAKLVTATMVLYVAAMILAALFLLDSLELAKALHAGERVSRQSFEALDRRADEVHWIYFGLLGLSAVAFGAWTHRAARNAASRLSFNPGWAVGYYIVPVLCLWRPCSALAEVWNASDPDVTAEHVERIPPLLLLWWLVWLGSSWVAGLLVRSTAADAQQWIELIHLDLAALVVRAVAVVPALVVVWKLTERQEQRAAALIPQARINQD